MVPSKLLCMVLLGLAVIGCSRSTGSADAPAGSQPFSGPSSELQELVGQLCSAECETFRNACDRLFDQGMAAVPVLLEHATDADEAVFLPPIFVNVRYSCMSPLWPMPEWTRGHVVLYLLEGIRVGHLAHSFFPRFRVAGVWDDVELAQAEYRAWWDSLQAGGITHEPSVSWSPVPDEVRARPGDQYERVTCAVPVRLSPPPTSGPSADSDSYSPVAPAVER
jgi:hypothetical protein